METYGCYRLQSKDQLGLSKAIHQGTTKKGRYSPSHAVYGRIKAMEEHR